MTATPAQTMTVTGTCGRCDGRGKLPAFGHYVGGLCFACSGSGTATMTVTAEDAARRAANAATAERQNAWLASLPTDPKVVVAAFRRIGSDKLTSIRNACADINLCERDANHEHRTPGARMAYWAASTVLNAWPDGRAYPESWITVD
jgi:hypothetical protein